MTELTPQHPDFWLKTDLPTRKEAVLSQAFLCGGDGIALSPLTNVAGGYGEAVLALEHDGMLKRADEKVRGCTLFSLTPKGHVMHNALKTA